jgi:hypothetical protein
MSAAISLAKFSFVLATAACCLAGTGIAVAESTPDTENGRYTLAPAGDGLIRLDTRTGAVSNCNDSSTGWACYAVPDERAAMDVEIGRLQAENEKLKAQLASRDGTVRGTVQGKSDDALPKADRQPGPKIVEPKTPDGERKLEIPLPSDQDMDRLMSFVERAWRRLVEMANRIQKDVSGKI